MRLRTLLPPLALLALSLWGRPGRAQLLRGFVGFQPYVLTDRFPGGYGTAAADINRDGRPDLLALGSTVIWFENGPWLPHPITAGKANIAMAAGDLEGDGQTDLCVASEFALSPSDRGGLVQWFSRPASLDREWVPHRIDEQPTTHRIRFADVDGDGRRELVVIPILGKGARTPYTDVPARILCYRVPSPPGPTWSPVVVDETLHLVHEGTVTDWDGDRREDLLVACMEGVFLLRSSGAGGALKWERTRLGAGEQARQAPNLGASEVQVGRLKGVRKGYVATVEPWHGDEVVVYTPPTAAGPASDPNLWRRNVIDLPSRDGHGLATADLDGDGLDEIIVGFRAGRQLLVYQCLDATGLRWQRHTLDASFSPSGVCVADFDGDGLPDIGAIGNPFVKWYRNRGR